MVTTLPLFVSLLGGAVALVVMVRAARIVVGFYLVVAYFVFIRSQGEYLTFQGQDESDNILHRLLLNGIF